MVGAWNVRLFSPDWVGRNLLVGHQLSIEVPLNAPGQHMRFTTTSGVILIASDDRVVFGMQDATSEGMRRAETLAMSLLSILPHTPLRAVGFNFGFDDPAPRDEVTALFRTSDLGKLSNFNCVVERTSIARRLAVEEQLVNVTHTLADGSISVDLNFHHDTTSVADAQAFLADRSEKCLSLAARLMSSVYGATLEEEGSDGHD